ncbi:hypothetical protein [Alteromonas gracilis]|uniref:hypothetical protein n=1 Tax=Alteromonas gracilis TaxID=1479524 RepID=UPI003734D415
MPMRKISFWGDIVFTILTSIVVIMCFFNPQLFVENSVLSIVIFVGGGLLPLKYILRTAQPARGR